MVGAMGAISGSLTRGRPTFLSVGLQAGQISRANQQSRTILASPRRKNGGGSNSGAASYQLTSQVPSPSLHYHHSLSIYIPVCLSDTDDGY